jgi:hypothetical protein
MKWLALNLYERSTRTSRPSLGPPAETSRVKFAEDILKKKGGKRRIDKV